jgi:hypothetical protein
VRYSLAAPQPTRQAPERNPRPSVADWDSSEERWEWNGGGGREDEERKKCSSNGKGGRTVDTG